MRVQLLIDKADAFFGRLSTTPVPNTPVSARSIAEAWAAACALAPERALTLFDDPIARIAAANMHGLTEALRHVVDDMDNNQRPDLRIAASTWMAILLAELAPSHESHHVARLALVQYARTTAPHRLHLSRRMHRLLMRRLGLSIPAVVPVGFKVAVCRYGFRWRGMPTAWFPPIGTNDLNILRRQAEEARASDKVGAASAGESVAAAAATSPPLAVQWSLPDIVAALSETVVGQEEAIRAFSCCCWRHQQGISQGVLISGPTGSGKSLLARRWAELSGRPVVSLDFSNLVPEGIRGTSDGDGILGLWRAAGRDVSRASKGIIIFDEFDKPSHYATEVRSSLLTLLDGMPWNAFDPEKIDRGHRLDSIPTRGLMIIFAGSYTKLRDEWASTMGFGASSIRSDHARLDLETLVPLADLRGRIGSLVEIAPLNHVTLARILASEAGPFASLRLAFPSWEIRPSDALVDQLVSHALEAGVGARALWPLARRIEDDVLHDPPNRPGEYHGVIFGWPISRFSVMQKTVDALGVA